MSVIKDNFTITPNMAIELWFDGKITEAEMKVFTFLCKWINGDDGCSIAFITKGTKVSDCTVKKAVNKFVKLDWIERINNFDNRGMKIANTFKLQGQAIWKTDNSSMGTPSMGTSLTTCNDSCKNDKNGTKTTSSSYNKETFQRSKGIKLEEKQEIEFEQEFTPENVVYTWISEYPDYAEHLHTKLDIYIDLISRLSAIDFSRKDIDNYIPKLLKLLLPELKKPNTAWEKHIEKTIYTAIATVHPEAPETQEIIAPVKKEKVMPQNAGYSCSQEVADSMEVWVPKHLRKDV